MSLKIYGIAASRAIRPLWLAEEMGLAYQQVPVDFKTGGPRTPEMLALNPNGHIPVIDDDGTVVWESLATTLYLARRYGGPLAPADVKEEAQCLQWSFWVVNEVERDALTILMHRMVLPEDRRDVAHADKAAARLKPCFDVLEAHLAAKPEGERFVAASRFTVADVNCAAILMWARPEKALMDTHPQVQAWLKACLARPAYQKAKALA
jgi:glutathione S-transferase